MITIENLILKTVDEQKASSVKQIVDLLADKFTEAELLEAIKKLEDKREIELNHNVPFHCSFVQYLANADYNLWLYLVFSASLCTSVTIYLIPNTYPLIITRWILCFLFNLFLPGYTLIEALFPKRGDLGIIERFALSIGLSLAVTPLIGLLLNYTPWGIRLDPIVVSLTLFTLGLCLLAAHRKFAKCRDWHITHAVASKKGLRA